MNLLFHDQKVTQQDLSKLIEITKNSELFKKVFEEQGNDKIHIACCKSMKIRNYHQNEVIIRYGEPAKDFFVILEGKVSIRLPYSSVRSEPKSLNTQPRSVWSINNKSFGSAILNKVLGLEVHEEVKTLHTGEMFGELALISDRPRAATVVAKSKVTLGILSKEVFQKQLSRYAERNLNEKIDFFQSLPVFKLRSRHQLIKISYYFGLKRLGWNQILYKEGDPLAWIYIVKKGEVMVRFKKITQSMMQEERKGINKHHRQFSHQISLNLFKKGPGMVLGIDEFLAGETKMRQSAQCVSHLGEVYVISKYVRSKKDFSARVFKPEFAAAIRDSYLDRKEDVQKRYLVSCSTERKKVNMNKLTFDKVKGKKMVRMKEFLEKRRGALQEAKAKEMALDGCAGILYSNRRTGFDEVKDKGGLDSRKFLTRTSSTIDMNSRQYENIFKTYIEYL